MSLIAIFVKMLLHKRRKKMKILKNIVKSIILALLLASIILVGVPVNAQQIIPPVIDVPSGVTPKISLDTIAYLRLD